MCLLVAAGGKTQGNASLAWSTHFGVEGHKSSDKPQHSVKSLGNGCGQVPGSLLHSKAVVKCYVGQHSMGQCPGVVHKYSLQDNVQRMGGGSCFRTLLTEREQSCLSQQHRVLQPSWCGCRVHSILQHGNSLLYIKPTRRWSQTMKTTEKNQFCRCDLFSMSREWQCSITRCFEVPSPASFTIHAL